MSVKIRVIQTRFFVMRLLCLLIVPLVSFSTLAEEFECVTSIKGEDITIAYDIEKIPEFSKNVTLRDIFFGGRLCEGYLTLRHWTPELSGEERGALCLNWDEVNETYASFEVGERDAYLHCKPLTDDLLFSTAYPKSFYQTDNFSYLLIGGTIVASAVATYATAGVGAPAIVPGASSLIVAIGGGSQGAYMAGLSTIGSVIGSNAIGGAAIINGVGAAVGLSATVKNAAVFGVALKSMTGIAAAGYDGILVGENKKTDKLTMVTELRLPLEIGSKRVRALAESVLDNENRVADSSEEKDLYNAKRYQSYVLADLKAGVELLAKCMDTCVSPGAEDESLGLHRDDLITLGIMAHKQGDFELFQGAIDLAHRSARGFYRSKPFLDYLYGYSLIVQGRGDEGSKFLLDAADAEEGAIEPSILYIVYLASVDFKSNEGEINSRVKILESEFDDDHYDSIYSLSTMYFRLGIIYGDNGRYVKALHYLKKAKSSLNWTQKWPVMGRFVHQKFLADIDLKIANVLYLHGQPGQARKHFYKLEERLEDSPEIEREALRRAYVGKL
ncbi:MAG: hypothetical protein ABGX41_09565 [Pseudohongiella sp.]